MAQFYTCTYNVSVQNCGFVSKNHNAVNAKICQGDDTRLPSIHGIIGTNYAFNDKRDAGVRDMAYSTFLLRLNMNNMVGHFCIERGATCFGGLRLYGAPHRHSECERAVQIHQPGLPL